MSASACLLRALVVAGPTAGTDLERPERRFVVRAAGARQLRLERYCAFVGLGADHGMETVPCAGSRALQMAPVRMQGELAD